MDVRPRPVDDASPLPFNSPAGAAVACDGDNRMAMNVTAEAEALQRRSFRLRMSDVDTSIRRSGRSERNVTCRDVPDDGNHIPTRNAAGQGGLARQKQTVTRERDQDFRFMEVRKDPTCFVGDESVERGKAFVRYSLAVLIKIIKAPQMEAVIEKLVGFSTKGDEEGSTSTRVAQTACEKPLPKLLTQLAPANDTLPPETPVETPTIVGILVQRFPASSRAIATLSLLVPLCADVAPVGEGPREICGLVEESIVPYLQPQLRTVLTLSLPDITPGILTALDRADDELRESALMALEALVLHCPTKMSIFTSTSVVAAGCKSIKYDPNYTAEEDDDDEMVSPSDEDDGEDEEHNDDLNDEYSHDKGTSYRIRGAAVKVLTASITTRPDLLAQTFITVALVLVARLTEREAGTCWYSTVADGSAAFITSSSKHDDDDDAMEESDRSTNESPVTLLRTHVPAFTKALLKDLCTIGVKDTKVYSGKGKPSTPATLQAALKHSLIGVLPGCLIADAERIMLLSSTVLAQLPSSNTAELHLTCLAFLADFFKTHDVQACFVAMHMFPGLIDLCMQTYAGLLPDLTPVLLRGAAERHSRVVTQLATWPGRLHGTGTVLALPSGHAIGHAGGHDGHHVWRGKCWKMLLEFLGKRVRDGMAETSPLAAVATAVESDEVIGPMPMPADTGASKGAELLLPVLLTMSLKDLDAPDRISIVVRPRNPNAPSAHTPTTATSTPPSIVNITISSDNEHSIIGTVTSIYNVPVDFIDSKESSGLPGCDLEAHARRCATQGMRSHMKKRGHWFDHWGRSKKMKNHDHVMEDIKRNTDSFAALSARGGVLSAPLMLYDDDRTLASGIPTPYTPPLHEPERSQVECNGSQPLPEESVLELAQALATSKFAPAITVPPTAASVSASATPAEANGRYGTLCLHNVLQFERELFQDSLCTTVADVLRILFRQIDDYPLITTCQSKACGFLGMIAHGYPDYNCSISFDKAPIDYNTNEQVLNVMQPSQRSQGCLSCLCF
ncbi:hypothetical protein FISHEDRAFT_70485 [Fistulina hepatica ATCC 64428]|uniref:Uncharacterized protein n=1 Tax=Fistulina hepatica ATCC 64428 TaxID=1128425 RepID=A0A0D7AJL4_9AGAR|nr:hypothetical protein FISHEDRAFT_70485 [Fistulina hepatica ATCC 64428]